MYIKKAISVILIVTVLCGSLSTFYATTETPIQDVDYGFVADPYDRLETSLEDGTVELAIKYDPRILGYNTVTKNQNPYRLCWMYSTIGAAEQYISRNYGNEFDLSEAHGAVAYSNSIIPQESSSNDGYYNDVPNVGRFTADALQYLSNWNEPILEHNSVHWNSMVNEEEYPKAQLNPSYSVPITESFTDAKSTFNLTGIKYLEDSVDTIKTAIKNYGGVITDLYIQQYLLNRDSNNEYNLCFIQDGNTTDKKAPNHSIVLVGWDDSYSRNNFDASNRPQNDGAWLVRNSWYNQDSNNYFWVSYEHTSLHSNSSKRIAITSMKEADDSEYMLSYDYMALANCDTEYSETVYLCNIFDISDYTNTYNSIKGVMLYLKSTGCQYRVKIAQLDDNNNLPANLDDLGVVASGNHIGEGYVYANFNQEYVFTSNNRCAVIVELIPNSSTSTISLPYEGSVNSEINANESFYGFDTDNNQIIWTDCYYNRYHNINSVPKGNFCIRPILKKTTPDNHYANITPSTIVDNNQDVSVNFVTDSIFLYARTKSYYFLRNKTDYTKGDGNVIIKSDFINSLDDKYTEILFFFSNNIVKTLVINPKATIDRVNIVGDPIVGETLTAQCVGNPEKNEYDVNYQWQISPNGRSWYDITNANSNTYTITENEYNLYIRAKVSSNSIFGNVVYPLEITSLSTPYKVVILGDVDFNGIVRTDDATLVNKYLVGLATLDDRQLLAADANRDGVVNISDVTRIQEIAVGL